ncbi:hypothetical protein ACFL3V_00280 [Nanoarchaeota archaeon]
MQYKMRQSTEQQYETHLEIMLGMVKQTRKQSPEACRLYDRLVRSNIDNARERGYSSLADMYVPLFQQQGIDI